MTEIRLNIRNVFSVPERYFDSATFSPGGGQIALSGADGYLAVASVTSEFTFSPVFEKRGVCAGAPEFSRDGSLLVFRRVDRDGIGILKLVDFGIKRYPIDQVSCFAVSPFEDLCVLGMFDGEASVYRFSATGLQREYNLPKRRPCVVSCAFSRSGDQVAVAHVDGQVLVSSVPRQRGSASYTLQLPVHPPSAVVWGVDVRKGGPLLAVSVPSAAYGTSGPSSPLRCWPLSEEGVASLFFSADSSLLACANEHVVSVVETATDRRFELRLEETKRICYVRFHPRERFVLLACDWNRGCVYVLSVSQ
jgi:WD40 repeat protein